MKTRVTLILLSAIFASTQNSVFAQDFLVSREDTACDFSHSNPVVFPDGSKGFLVVWEDTRNGPPHYYAQQFDSLAQPIGRNFPIYSNMDVVYGPAGSFLVENSEWVTYGANVPQFDRHYVKVRLCKTDGTSSQPTILLDAGQTSIDCIGVCIGYSIDLVSISSGYVSVLNNKGSLSLSKRDWNGDILWNWYSATPAIYPDTVHSTQFSVCSNPSDYLAAVWVNVPSLDPFADTTHEIMGSFFDKNGDTIATNVMLKTETPAHFDLNWWENEQVRAIALSDSLYEIFDYDADAFTLNYWTVDTAGRRVGGINALEIYHDTALPNIPSQHTMNFSFTPIVNGNFSLLLTVSEYISSHARYYSSLLTFDNNGRMTGAPVTDTTATFSVGKEFFRLPDSKVVIPMVQNSDIYLTNYQGLTATGMSKVNDNPRGSNDMLTGVRTFGSNGFMINWKDSKNSFGRIIGADGTLLGAPVEPAPAAPDTLANGNRITLWNKADAESLYAFGYTVYDKSQVPVLTDTLAHNREAGWMFGISYSLHDTSFAVLYANGTVLNLRHVESDGRYREVAIPAQYDGYWSLKVFPESDTTFWIGYNYHIRLVNESLDQLGPEHQIFHFTNYLGNDRFLDLSVTPYVSGRLPGILHARIISADDSVMTGDFNIADSVNSYTSRSLSPGYFAVAYLRENQVYLATYDSTGSARVCPVAVSSDPTSAKTAPMLAQNRNSLLAVWSETRTLGKGYDVYGRIFEIDKLTSVASSQPRRPTAFVLYQNYPNPFNPSTTIRFDLKERSNVTLAVYNVLGQRVEYWNYGTMESGTYNKRINMVRFASGIYFYRIVAIEKGGQRFESVKKLVLMK